MTRAMLRKHDRAVVSRPLVLAATFGARLRGLLGRRSLATREGLLITPCRDVHTCGMRFTIDIVFLDDDLRILKLSPNARTWRFYSGGGQCKHVLELAAGATTNLDLQVGQILELNGVPGHDGCH